MRQERGAALLLVLAVTVLITLLVAAMYIGTDEELARRERRDRAAAAHSAFGNRAREAARNLGLGSATWNPLRATGDRHVALVALNGEALQTARHLHRLVRDLGLGADGVGFEATGPVPDSPEDATFDAGLVLAQRRTLTGDRFTELADLLAVKRPSGAPIWDPTKPAEMREFRLISRFLLVGATPRAAAAGGSSLLDLNGDPLETARLLHALLGLIRDPDGNPLGANGVGIELATSAPGFGDLTGAALSSGSPFSDVAVIVRAGIARRFSSIDGLLRVRRERKLASSIALGSVIWPAAVRWEFERLAAFLVASDLPAGPRRIDVNHAPRELLAAAYDVHLGQSSPLLLADKTIAARRKTPFATPAAFASFLALQGVTPSAPRLARFSVDLDAVHHLRLSLAPTQAATTDPAHYDEATGDGALSARPRTEPVTLAGRIEPVLLRTTSVPTPTSAQLQPDPWALALRGGRPLLSGSLPAGGASVSRAINLPAGTRTLGLTVWLKGTSDTDGDLQSLRLQDGTLWRALASGGTERQVKFVGPLGTRWLPAVSGLDPKLPVVALAGVALHALQSNGRISRWRETTGDWSVVPGPLLAADDRVTAIELVKTTEERLYAGTLRGRLFRKAASGAWTDRGTITGAPPILSLRILDATTELLLAGTRGVGVWRHTPAAGWKAEAGLLSSSAVGALVKLTDGRTIAGAAGGLYLRSLAGAWSLETLAGVGVASLWTDGVTLLAGTIGSGVHAGKPGGPWSRIDGGAAGTANLRAVGRDAAGRLVWGAAADGGVALEAVLTDSAGDSVALIPPALLPYAGAGRRLHRFQAVLSGRAVKLTVRAVTYARTGAPIGSVPTLLEVALSTSATLRVTHVRSVPGEPAKQRAGLLKGMRRED